VYRFYLSIIYRKMSVLANTVQANRQSYFFALAGGGGGGTTLQSPASVNPDGTGTATLAVSANQAGGSAAVAVVGGATSSGAITVGGYGTTYRAAVLGPAPILPSLPALTIGLNSSATPAISYDGGNGSLILGDGSLGTIQTRNALFVSDVATSGNNKLGMSPLTATTSVISQSMPGGGTVSIGSSTPFPATLVVSDVPKNGAGNWVEVNGASGQVPLFISGSQGVGGNCYIYPDSPGNASVMNVGSSQINPSAITMTDAGVAGSGRTVIANQAPPSIVNNICTINGQQATIPNTTSTIDLPAGVVLTDGLFYFAVNITGAGNPQFQASCIVYYNGTTFSTGGSVQSAVDGNGKYLQMYPAGGNMQISFNGAASLPGYVVITPLFNAPIIGFA